MDDATLKRHGRLRELQRANVDAWRGLGPAPDPSGLDANLKKNTGFIKKCKANLGPESAPQLVREVTQLKLEKYVSEIVPAVLEGLQRCRTAGEFAAAIDVISALHARFPVQFTVPFVCQALRQLAPPSVPALVAMTPEQRERDEQARLGRQRPILRVVAEMYLGGLLWGIDAQPGGAGGVDLAAALALSHPSASSGGGGAASRLAAKMREAAQQPGHCVLVGAVQNLLAGDQEHHLSIILATIFAKTHRADLALGDGEIADSCACNVDAADLQDSQRAPVVSADACRRLRTLLDSYLESAAARLQTLHRGLVKMRARQEERLFTKGVVTADAKARLERHAKAFDKLNDSVGALCEALGRGPPDLDVAADDDPMDVVFDGPLAAGSGADGSGGGGGLWEDDEERVFYTSLVDLRSKIPSALLESGAKRQDPAGKAGKEQASSPAGDQAGPDEAADSAPDDGSGGDAALDDFDESAFEASLALDPADVGGPGDDGDDDADESQAALGILEYQRFIAQNQGDGAAGDGQGAGDAVGGGSPGPLLGGAGGADGRGSPRAAASPAVPEAPSEGMLTIVQQAGPAGGAAHMIASVSFAQLVRRLPTMTTKDDVDDAAVDFCYVNTRANRKALASVLLDAPRRQMFVIPLYARFLATLHPFFPDIGEAVVDELTRDFGWLVRKRVKGLLDAQLKNARYIAELTKFHVAPLHVAFRCARTLLEQFHVQNIEVLCALLDGCGRFLHAQPKTAARIEAILEILMRKRRVLNLDDRTILLIENAFNACQLHRARAARPEKFRTPYERYIRKLFYEDLAGDTVAAVCQLLRRLPWGDGTGDDPQRVRHALMCCFSKVWKIKHANLGLAAAALGALGCVHPWFRVAVVDAVAESIKLGLERSVFEHNQRRIAEVAYVGEMFGCGVVGPQVVLDLVRLLVAYGHRELPPQPGCGCELDPPSSYFRIRLVCTLLLACGSRLGSAAGPARMAELSLHLQMYILAKDHPLPVDIDYSVDNLFEAVFSQTPRFGSWGEAAQCAVSRAGQALPTPPAALATPENRAPSGEPLTAAGSGLGATASGSTSPPGSGADADADGSDAESDDAASVVSDTDRLLAEMEEAQRQREALEALLDREEEDALEHEFNKLMLEASDLRRTDSASKLDVGIPMSLIGRPVMRPPSADRADGSGAAIRLSLLTGKKQRPVVHELDIPAASRMAQSMRQQEESAMREKAHLKRIVLDYERREAEEEQRQYQRELAARRASAFPASGASAARPVVPGALFVNRPSLGAMRRQRHATGAGAPHDQQRQQQQQRAGAYPGIPDHFR